MSATTSDPLNVYAVERVHVETEHPVALGSADHLQPWGTARDNSRNPEFNAKLYELFKDRFPLRVLDLGCSGGGFVRECLDDGCLAVGIEGSDYSKRIGRAEWATLTDKRLFTADVTQPFNVSAEVDGQSQPLQFDVITSWEMLEHIAEEDLTALADNIRRHLAPGGLFIGSVSPLPEVINDVTLHLTVEQKPWWVERFAREGLTNIDSYGDWFNSQYVRGPKQNAPGSFHLFLSADPADAPKPRALTAREKLVDRWIGSAGYHAARRLVGADR